MTLKIISLVGSPHGLRGNTARLLSHVLEGAKTEGATNETVVLSGGNVLPCLACDTCHRKGKCPQKDEFESIKKRILESDGVVLASPNYIFSVSAQMKAFMDRCCGVIHCMAFEGKYGASVITSGGGEEEPIGQYMNHFLLTTGVIPVGSVWATMGTIAGEDFPEGILRQARELGKKLVRSWKEKAVIPWAEEIRKSFEERMRRLMLFRKEDWPYEYEFWKTRRELE
jgi:multimeric flavodoxin WrbA